MLSICDGPLIDYCISKSSGVTVQMSGALVSSVGYDVCARSIEAYWRGVGLQSKLKSSLRGGQEPWNSGVTAFAQSPTIQRRLITTLIAPRLCNQCPQEVDSMTDP